MKDSRPGAPVYVKVDEYKEILDVLEMIKGKIKEIKSTLNEINNLRTEEDSDLQVWNNALADIERKIEGIDKMLFEPEQSW